ncbi:MAG TPA: hypothetical protein VK760_11005 [Candidatus Acidoferrales bacterium]|jgi:hypothetical protein|nr:hypothetical protein [Candidatus Acidoferrales bacterium]
MHVDEGTLRRSIDEIDSLDAGARAHLDGCAQCRDLRSELERTASFAHGYLAQDLPAFQARNRTAHAVLPRRRPVWFAPAIALAAAACVAFALAFTPLGGIAGQWLTIFEPKQFVALQISPTDSEQLRLVPTLQRLGTFAASKPPAGRGVTSFSGLDRTLGFEPRTFGGASLGDWRPQPSYVQKPFSTSFTFSAAKAKAYEATFNRSLPPMPAGLDGATYTATYGPTLVRTFAKGDARIAFVETKAPRLVSSGASLETAANYLLSMPNVPAGVAAQLRAIADPAHTLPIPYAFDKQTATPVTVDGVAGLAIGDESRFGAGVLWTKDGVVYLVGGQMKESEAIALANSVK